jgi:GT2 family glycosyltransferase
MQHVTGEVFVVDNNSIDGSVAMVEEKFPEYELIANKDNLGFSKANNQAMRLSKGEYVLLLNPDTIVEEDTFSKIVAFMDEHPNSGGLGVRMVDGKGQFLPESKRGLPTPAVAFYKIFGISSIFPKSKRYGRYHLGYLSEFETNKIEILSGAFMMMRKKALDEVGLLDEAFFMYGEDIDLSWRIIKGGYDNYYFPDTRIIHYKGESTKKSSVNYVFVFYNAMIIFAKKHFSQKNAKLFSFLINMAIYLRAGVAIFSRLVKKMILPVIDLAAITSLLFLLIQPYQSNRGIEYEFDLIKWALPAYGLCWLISTLYSGGYDRPIKLLRYLSGVGVGTVILLLIYALLPKEMRFSRGFLFIGAAGTLTYYLLSRLFLHVVYKKKFSLKGSPNLNFAVVGDAEEIERVSNILKQTNPNIKNIIAVSTIQDDQVERHVSQLGQMIDMKKVDEVVFCAKNNSAQEIIKYMIDYGSDAIDFKIAQPETMFLIGSNSIDTSGDLYMVDIDRINQPFNRRNKRTIDFLLSFHLVLVSPLMCLFYKSKKTFFKNIFQVLLSKKSLVGYHSLENAKMLNGQGFHPQLPKIKSGVLTTVDEINNDQMIEETVHKLNFIYARNYSVFKDLRIFVKNLPRLGR